MQAMELLTPWFTFIVILLPVLHLERWIHQHLYGVGWLFTREKQRATILYYLILLPGVFLHEFTQWLVAGALNLKTSQIKIWPKPQANGTLRLDFVRLSGKKAGKTAVTVFETAPLVVGIAAILFISQRVLDVNLLLNAFKTADLRIVQSAFGIVLGTPDFWLWLYLLFAIGNAMIPTDNLNTSWLFPTSLLIGAALLILGLLIPAPGIPTIQEPLSNMLNLLATAASTMLVMNLFSVILLGFTERVLERITGEQAKYPGPVTSKPIKLEPGGEVPLPENQAPERIANRRLPIPPPPPKSPVKHKPRPRIEPSPPPAATGRPSWIEQRTSASEEDTEILEPENDIDEQPVPAYDTADYADDDALNDDAPAENVSQTDEEESDDSEPTYIDLDSDIA
ncbi:MAG: hypothetical protein JXN59_04000 [Anaerolineae bacterium]|nr:hypothetical protein [Anaerolineae bacterium]